MYSTSVMITFRGGELVVRVCVCVCVVWVGFARLGHHSMHIFHKLSEAGNYFSQPEIDLSEVDSMHVLQGLG